MPIFCHRLCFTSGSKSINTPKSISTSPRWINKKLLCETAPSSALENVTDSVCMMALEWKESIYPNFKKPQITSIGKKEFCDVKGNGSYTLETLISNNHRIAHRKKILKKRFKKQWQQIIPLNKKILVEPIGNQNKGTIFYDGRNHYSEEMLEWVSDCVKNIKGFDYGRIDLKMEHWNSFKNKKGIKILEINGVNSEPIHIYDPRYSIWKAYKAIFHHMHIIYRLSKHKLNQSHQTCSLF